MPSYRDQAVVLRTYKLGEADRIIHLLSYDHGKIRAVAKGVRRPTSRLGGRVEVLSQVDAQFVVGRSLDILTQVETLEAFNKEVCADFDGFNAAQVIVEAVDRLIVEPGEPARAHYRLLVESLHKLRRCLRSGQPSAQMIAYIYLLKALSLAGYAPRLRDCSRCGLPGIHDWFSAQAGGMVCQECRDGYSQLLTGDLWRGLISIAGGEWTLGNADQDTERRFAQLVTQFCHWHIPERLRSLAMLNQQDDMN